MTETNRNISILHVIDREGGDTRLVAEINANWMLNLRVQQYAGFDFQDVASVAICGADLCSMLNRYRAQMEAQVRTEPPSPATGLEHETRIRPGDGRVQQHMAAEAEILRASDGKENGNVQ